MDGQAIIVKDLTKSFKVYLDKGSQLKDACFSAVETDMRNERFCVA